MGQFFGGESGTGAQNNRFFAEFDFRSLTGASQPGLRLTISPDDGVGGRQGFLALEDNGATGFNVTTFDVDSAGNFLGPITIASNLNYTDFHTLGLEVLFEDGASNDTINYFLDGALIHSGPSWEQFYRVFQPAIHPFGAPVQSLLFRLSGAAAPGTLGDGFIIDNVYTAVGPADQQLEAVPEPASIAVWFIAGLGLVGCALLGRRGRVTK